jgi:hypothetical protein
MAGGRAAHPRLRRSASSDSSASGRRPWPFDDHSPSPTAHAAGRRRHLAAEPSGAGGPSLLRGRRQGRAAPGLAPSPERPHDGLASDDARGRARAEAQLAAGIPRVAGGRRATDKRLIGERHRRGPRASGASPAAVEAAMRRDGRRAGGRRIAARVAVATAATPAAVGETTPSAASTTAPTATPRCRTTAAFAHRARIGGALRATGAEPAALPARRGGCTRWPRCPRTSSRSGTHCARSRAPQRPRCAPRGSNTSSDAGWKRSSCRKE